MKLNKDEARILSVALNDFKFRIDRNDLDGLFDKLDNLENKLSAFGKDERRTGRTSQNDWVDLLKRFAKK
jgi:hypothetical protein